MAGAGQIADTATPDRHEHIVANDPGYAFIGGRGGNWIERDGVWIIDRDGNAAKLLPLTDDSVDTRGPELGFGHPVWDLYENRVLLIKAAWGGKSLSVEMVKQLMSCSAPGFSSGSTR